MSLDPGIPVNPACSAEPERQDSVIREMDHRIKNHLQLLAAYARMASQRRGVTASELAEDMADKLAAIASAHEALHRAGGAGLARPFLETLTATFAGSRHKIHVDCDAELQLPAAELAPLGVVASEAIANALQHAFPAGRDGRIWVRLAQEADRVKLTVRDDGIGMVDLPGDGIRGSDLIHTLAGQLGGYARVGSAPFGGALVTVVYPRGA